VKRSEVSECWVRVSVMDDSFDTVALAMGTRSREESLFDQDDDETDGINRSFVSRDEEEHPPLTTPSSVSQTPATPTATTTTTMEPMWMNRFVSWWRGASQSSPGNLALLNCGLDTTTKSPEDPSLDERLAWNQAVAKLLRRSEFHTRASDSRTTTTINTLYTPIPHVRQLETWDCGVACVQMAWLWLNDSPSCSASSRSIQSSTTNSTDTDTDDTNTMVAATSGDHDNQRDWMLQQLQTQSVWTVDLVLLLDHLIRSSGSSISQQEASFLFSSNTLQVNETLGDIGYYRAAFLEDQRRVREHFGEIKRRQLLTVLQRCLPLEQIVALVREPDCIAICLVDNVVLLAHDDDDIVDNDDENTGDMICSAYTTASNHAGTQQHLHGVDDTYAGHYILLQGTSYQDDHLQQAGGTSIGAGYCFVVQNPGRSGTTYLSPDRFERAWRAEGTDEDILFVTKHNI
jgi:hypothetical protein